MWESDQNAIWQAIISNDPENVWKAVYNKNSDRYDTVID
jgi:hypothetical protein